MKLYAAIQENKIKNIAQYRSSMFLREIAVSRVVLKGYLIHQRVEA